MLVRMVEIPECPPPDAEAGGPMRTVVGADAPAGLGMLKPPAAGIVEIFGALALGIVAFGMFTPPGAGIVEIAGLGETAPGADGFGMLTPPTPGLAAFGTGAILAPRGAGMVEIAGPGPRRAGETGPGEPKCPPPGMGAGALGPGGGCMPPGGRIPGLCPCGKRGGAGTRCIPRG